MNSVFNFTAVFQKEDEGYSVWIPGIQGCVSQGNTYDEAMENIKSAIGLCFESAAETGNLPTNDGEAENIALENNQSLANVRFDFDEYRSTTKSKPNTYT